MYERNKHYTGAEISRAFSRSKPQSSGSVVSTDPKDNGIKNSIASRPETSRSDSSGDKQSIDQSQDEKDVLKEYQYAKPFTNNGASWVKYNPYVTLHKLVEDYLPLNKQILSYLTKHEYYDEKYNCYPVIALPLDIYGSKKRREKFIEEIKPNALNLDVMRQILHMSVSSIPIAEVCDIRRDSSFSLTANERSNEMATLDRETYMYDTDSWRVAKTEEDYYRNQSHNGIRLEAFKTKDKDVIDYKAHKCKWNKFIEVDGVKYTGYRPRPFYILTHYNFKILPFCSCFNILKHAKPIAIAGTPPVHDFLTHISQEFPYVATADQSRAGTAIPTDMMDLISAAFVFRASSFFDFSPNVKKLLLVAFLTSTHLPSFKYRDDRKYPMGKDFFVLKDVDLGNTDGNPITTTRNIIFLLYCIKLWCIEKGFTFSKIDDLLSFPWGVILLFGDNIAIFSKTKGVCDQYLKEISAVVSKCSYGSELVQDDKPEYLGFVYNQHAQIWYFSPFKIIKFLFPEHSVNSKMRKNPMAGFKSAYTLFNDIPSFVSNIDSKDKENVLKLFSALEKDLPPDNGEIDNPYDYGWKSELDTSIPMPENYYIRIILQDVVEALTLYKEPAFIPLKLSETVEHLLSKEEFLCQIQRP